MHKYNDGVESMTRIVAVERELEDVTGLMKDNINKVIERGERIDSLVNKSSALSQEAFTFRSASKTMKRRVWMKTFRHWPIFFCIFACTIYVVLATACGGWTLYSCFA
eukprot:GHVU01217370.1.p1 GENE.GHVU01217370.1~~GHVU01217370.1.p1  ORF type:complete len:108 (+),score=9.12 GHVU01217370.1:410-733(+)